MTEFTGELAEVTTSAELVPAHPPFTSVDINTYRTREILDLTIDGTDSKWHSVKGGVSPENVSDPSSIKYPLLFNPETNTWLKIVAPQVYGTEAEEIAVSRLKKAKYQQEVALELAGLGHLKDSIKDVEVEIAGKKVYGYTAPHIGPSLESRIFAETGRRKGINISPELSDLITYVYSSAADQAEKLYLDYGIWFSDPNPGNILLREEPDGIHVVLIDFSSKHQEKSNIFQNVTPGRYTESNYNKLVRRILASSIKNLHTRFALYCNSVGLPFIRDPKATEQNIENSTAVLNAGKMLPTT